MANQRAKNQQLLPFTVKREFLSQLDSALQQINVANRSQFIRDAILEKLKREGIHIPPNLASAPPRTLSPTPNRAARKAAPQVSSVKPSALTKLAEDASGFGKAKSG